MENGEVKCRDVLPKRLYYNNNNNNNPQNLRTKFRNQYRIKSARLPDYDYSQNNGYFVTICAKNREYYFGKIVDGETVLSGIGEIVKHEWEITPALRPDMNITLGQFVVMPNHFHGFIIVGNNKYNDDDGTIGYRRDAMHCVSTMGTMGTRMKMAKQMMRSKNNKITQQPYKNLFGPQSKNLASIVRGFKIGVTKNARKINPNFTWQPRFYEHIIRNELEYQRIAEYIYNNPMNWDNDDYF